MRVPLDCSHQAESNDVLYHLTISNLRIDLTVHFKLRLDQNANARCIVMFMMHIMYIMHNAVMGRSHGRLGHNAIAGKRNIAFLCEFIALKSLSMHFQWRGHDSYLTLDHQSKKQTYHSCLGLLTLLYELIEDQSLECAVIAAPLKILLR